MISLCEAVLATPTNNQPPNSSTAPVANQQQATTVPTQNQNPPVQNTTNPAAENNNNQSSFDWKKVLKPLAIGGAAIGTLGLAHAMYNGNSLNPLDYLPKLGSGANIIDNGAGADGSVTTAGGGDTTETGVNYADVPKTPKKTPRLTQPTNEITTSAPMQGPPPQEYIPQRTRVYMYREAHPMHPPRSGGLSYLFGSPHLPPRRYYGVW